MYFLLGRVKAQIFHPPLSFKGFILFKISEPVNGSATLKCPVNKNRAVEFVYFQKGDFFVNGHHSENHITGKWNNTKMDKNFTFYMYNLERSQSGHYKCIIMYKNDKDPVIHEYNLTVTVPYSKPSFTKECNKRNDIRSCQVTCMAQDGYPSQKIWIVLVQSGNDNNGMVTSRNDSVFNLTTKLFSSTVTVEFNCSNTEVEFVCSVGGVVSETISICEPVFCFQSSFRNYVTEIFLAFFFWNRLGIFLHELYSQKTG
uniref:Immunoglobulin-like beta-sandwich domain-containing protein n=1 Tax=Oryzias sinensis TaxID=183150 RepID=A0A8C7X5N5_9TELE